jgi:non-specific serine/threonine protein kinase
MKVTTAPVVSIAANVTSITYSYSPSLPRSADSPWLAPSHHLPLATQEESLFLRQGDYWVIRYQGQLAFLKATRGLECLSLLLQHPDREFHVSELLGLAVGRPVESAPNGHASATGRGRLLSDAGPLLDRQAKAEYKRRLDDLRRDLNEAERSNDTYRAEQARTEMNALAEQLASAIGLGGRDRKTGSEAERARCAVTKRIKDSINKIGEAIPSLRRYLAVQIRTGYFCSYNLSQEHPVAWKFLILVTALCCEAESYIVT